jgi:hypothetical protein
MGGRLQVLAAIWRDGQPCSSSQMKTPIGGLLASQPPTLCQPRISRWHLIDFTNSRATGCGQWGRTVAGGFKRGKLGEHGPGSDVPLRKAPRECGHGLAGARAKGGAWPGL